MGTPVFKEVNYSLSGLLEYVELGEIGLPDIQRPFVWSNAKVRDLFDSMYRGFPVGFLLFWVNSMADGTRQIGVYDKQKAPRLLIVDGQQRLTSLYAVMKAQPVVRSDYSQQRLYIAFRPRDAKFEVTDAAISRDPEFISDISQLWAGAVSRNKFVRQFVERLRQHRIVTDEEEDALSESIDLLYDLRNYPFTALELAPTVDEAQVAEVFVRVNSEGVKLKQADFILTLMSVFWDEGRTELELFCRDARQPSSGKPSPFNHFIQPDPDQLLRVSVALAFRRARLTHVYSILRGKDLATKQFSEERRIEQFAALAKAQAYALDLTNWHEFLKTLVRSGFRGELMISSHTGLLYSYAMYLLGKRDYGLDHYQLRELIARWFFMVSLTSRYSGSPETIMEEDLARLRTVKSPSGFVETLDRIITDTFTEDFWSITLPNNLATSAARSPAFFAYGAALNLLDARVLFSRMKVSELLDPALKSKKAPIERHHLFPRNYLKSIGVEDTRDTNQTANYALVEWSDNIDISDSPPSEYFPRYVQELGIGDAELERLRFWHALPEGWESMPYQEFLVARRKAIAEVIRYGFNQLLKNKDKSENPQAVQAGGVHSA